MGFNNSDYATSCKKRHYNNSYYNDQNFMPNDNYYTMQDVTPVNNYYTMQDVAPINNYYTMQDTAPIGNYYTMQDVAPISNYSGVQQALPSAGVNNLAVNPGNVERVRNDYSVNGSNYSTENGKYVDNYYARYNNHYINNVNYVTDYVYDYNVYHVNNSTVHRGTQYMGSRDVYATNTCGGSSPIVPIGPSVPSGNCNSRPVNGSYCGNTNPNTHHHCHHHDCHHHDCHCGCCD